jgi:PhzF family phenazine biosynthesis protein
MSTRLLLIDAFTDGPFSGNPAAVCLLNTFVASDWMQAVAAELNQSETAFIQPLSNGWGLRWFTPLMEVDLCGHATVAAAHALWSEGCLPRTEPARFHTRSGVLLAKSVGEAVEVDFPAVAMTACAPPEGLIDALGIQPLSVFRAGPDYVVEALDAEAVREAQPDLAALAMIDTRGVAITAQGTGACDVVSRFFAPAVGIPEDPVTGSVHCALGPFWARRLRRPTLRCHQWSRRSGILYVTPQQERVLLRGSAITVLEGKWH